MLRLRTISSQKSGFTLLELMTVVAIIGILAAVAIPAFINYIRKSKATEVHESLDRCYKGVVDYYEKPMGVTDGTVVSQKLPPSMAGRCAPPLPLSGDSHFIAAAEYLVGGACEVLRSINFVVTEATYAAFAYTSASGGMTPNDNDTFDCEAWTDIDGDTLESHWVKRGTFNTSTSSFSGGHVWHDDGSDDW